MRSIVRLFAIFLVVLGFVAGAATAQETPAPTSPPVVQQAPAQQPASPAEVPASPASEAPANDGAPGSAPVAAPVPEAPADGDQQAQPDPDRPLPHNLSPWGMFMAADLVVKAVMLGLAFASLVTWTIWIYKSIELAAAKRQATKTLGAIADAHSLNDAAAAVAGQKHPSALLVQSAVQEVAMSTGALDHADSSGLKERVASRLSRIEAQAGRAMTRGTGLIATIGSTAPFVGLFGTVWGIMNSFIGISESQTTNLAVVAPGIAEALLATAIGLVAAIPAVVIYNVFARAIGGYRQQLADASAGVERLISRDLDFREVPGQRRMAAE